MTKVKHTIWIPSGMSSEKKSKLSKELYSVVSKHTNRSETGYRSKKKKNKFTYGKNKK
jgi:hypothetical protein